MSDVYIPALKKGCSVMIQEVSDIGTRVISLTFINHRRILVHVEKRLPVSKFILLEFYRQSTLVEFCHVFKTILTEIPVNDLPNGMHTVKTWLITVLDRFVPRVIERIHLPVATHIIVKAMYLCFKREIVLHFRRCVNPSNL